MAKELTKEQCERERNHLEMIKHQEWWPGILLAMRRRDESIKSAIPYQIGRLNARKNKADGYTLHKFKIDDPRVYDGFEEFATAEDIIAAGWEVD